MESWWTGKNDRKEICIHTADEMFDSTLTRSTAPQWSSSSDGLDGRKQQERESQTTAQPPQCACVGVSYFAKRPIRWGSAGNGICTLHLLVISVMVVGVMWLSYNVLWTVNFELYHAHDIIIIRYSFLYHMFWSILAVSADVFLSMLVFLWALIAIEFWW